MYPPSFIYTCSRCFQSMYSCSKCLAFHAIMQNLARGNLVWKKLAKITRIQAAIVILNINCCVSFEYLRLLSIRKITGLTHILIREIPLSTCTRCTHTSHQQFPTPFFYHQYKQNFWSTRCQCKAISSFLFLNCMNNPRQTNQGHKRTLRKNNLLSQNKTRHLLLLL